MRRAPSSRDVAATLTYCTVDKMCTTYNIRAVQSCDANGVIFLSDLSLAHTGQKSGLEKGSVALKIQTAFTFISACHDNSEISKKKKGVP